jgi:hypothetical protein
MVLLTGCAEVNWNRKMQTQYFDKDGNKAGLSGSWPCIKQALKEAYPNALDRQTHTCSKNPLCKELAETCMEQNGFTLIQENTKVKESYTKAKEAYKKGDYFLARQYIDYALQSRPNSQLFLKLKQDIEKSTERKYIEKRQEEYSSFFIPSHPG